SDLALLRIDRGDGCTKSEFDTGLCVVGVGSERHPILRRLASQIILRQVGTIDRRCGIIADHGDQTGKSLPPKHLGCGKAGAAAADDDDSVRRRSGSARRGWRFLCRVPLTANKEPVALALDLPDRERGQRGGTYRFAAPQREAGMVPGAANGVIDDQPLRERSMIVAAECIDGENLGAKLDQEHLLVADMTEQLAICEISQRHALREIGSAWLVILTHVISPLPASSA